MKTTKAKATHRTKSIRFRTKRIAKNLLKIVALLCQTLFLIVRTLFLICEKILCFLYNYKKIVLTILLVTVTLLVLWACLILGPLGFLIRLAESIGYKYQWSDADTTLYTRLSIWRSQYIASNPVAELLSNMGGNLFTRLLRTFGVFALLVTNYFWFKPLIVSIKKDHKAKKESKKRRKHVRRS